jgi:hypothetical protein
MTLEGGSKEGGGTFTQRVLSIDGIVVYLHVNHTLPRQGVWLHD